MMFPWHAYNAGAVWFPSFHVLYIKSFCMRSPCFYMKGEGAIGYVGQNIIPHRNVILYELAFVYSFPEGALFVVDCKRAPIHVKLFFCFDYFAFNFRPIA